MSKAMMQQELELALQYRDMLLKADPSHLTAIHLYDMIEPELVKLLYAKNQDLADIAYQKINTLQSLHLAQDDPDFKSLTNLLHTLRDSRNRYLESPSESFFSYWGQQGWTGANLALASLPLLLGAAFPPVGITFLLYLGISSASSAIDFTRSSRDYWVEEQPPRSRELSPEQITRLQKSYEDIDVFLPENNPTKHNPIDKKIQTASYITYTLVFAICLIGLTAFLFPPIGIPALALFVLSVVAVVGTGAQCGFLYQKQQQQQAEIQHEKDMSYYSEQPTEGKEHDSTFLIARSLPKPSYSQRRQKSLGTPSVPSSGNNTHEIELSPLLTPSHQPKQDDTDQDEEGDSGPKP